MANLEFIKFWTKNILHCWNCWSKSSTTHITQNYLNHWCPCHHKAISIICTIFGQWKFNKKIWKLSRRRDQECCKGGLAFHGSRMKVGESLQTFPGQCSCSWDSSSCPALALGSHHSQLLLEARVRHLCVLPGAKVRVVQEELLVALVKEVALWVVEAGVDCPVQGSVSLPQLGVEVGCSLARELAMEDDNISLVLIERSGLWLLRQGLCWQYCGEKLLILSVLPVLRSLNVTSLVLELVPNIDDPEEEVK